MTKKEVCVRLLEREWTRAPGSRRPRAHGVPVECCRRGRSVCGVEGVRAVVAARQLILMFVVVIVDRTKLQGVGPQNLRHIAVSRVVDVVVLIRAKIADAVASGVGETPACDRKRWHTAQNILKRQRASQGRLNIGRLREILGASHLA